MNPSLSPLSKFFFSLMASLLHPYYFIALKEVWKVEIRVKKKLHHGPKAKEHKRPEEYRGL